MCVLFIFLSESQMTKALGIDGISNGIKKVADVVFARPPHDKPFLQGFNPLAWFWWGVFSTDQQRRDSGHDGSRIQHLQHGGIITAAYTLVIAAGIGVTSLIKTNDREISAATTLSTSTPWNDGVSTATIIPVKTWFFNSDDPQMVTFQDWTQKFNESTGPVFKHCRAIFERSANQTDQGDQTKLSRYMPANPYQPVVNGQRGLVSQSCDMNDHRLKPVVSDYG
jgi:hypothetical protein